MSRLNDMVGRILTEEFRFHLFAREQTGGPSAVVTNDRHAAVARRVAEQGTVLLRNAGGVLPLNGRTLHSIAVIGPDGGEAAVTGGGGSAAVVAPYVITPFRGIADRAGAGVDVRYAQGALPPNASLPAVPPRYLAPPSGGSQGLCRLQLPRIDSLGGTIEAVDADIGQMLNEFEDFPQLCLLG